MNQNHSLKIIMLATLNLK